MEIGKKSTDFSQKEAEISSVLGKVETISFKEEINEKNSLVSSVVLVFHQALRSKRKLIKADLRNLELENLDQELKNRLNSFCNVLGSLEKSTQKVEDYICRFFESVQGLETSVHTLLKQKIGQMINVKQNTKQKITQLLAAKGDVLSSHENMMESKVQEVNSIRSEITEIVQAREDTLHQINSVSEEIDVDCQRLEDVNVKLSEADNVIKEIESGDSSTAHLVSEVEAKVEAMNGLKSSSEALECEISSLMQAKEMMEQEKQSAAIRLADLELILNDMAFLMDLTRRKVDFSVLESDETFQRVIIPLDFYTNSRSTVEQKQIDNMDINNDVERKYLEIEAQQPGIQNLKAKVDEFDGSIRCIQMVIDEMNQLSETIQKQLEAFLNDTQKVSNVLQKEINELEAEDSEASNELDRVAKKHEKAVAVLALKLKNEKAKTQRAKEQQKTRSEAFAQTLKQRKREDERRNTLSQNKSSLKRLFPEDQNSSQKPHSSTFSPRYLSKEIGSSPKQQKVSNENIPSNAIPILKPDVPVSAANHTFPVAKLPAMASTVISDPTEKKDSTFDRLKEISTVGNVSATNVKEVKFVNPFDSDDESSFDVTFNTDVEDFLE